MAGADSHHHRAVHRRVDARQPGADRGRGPAAAARPALRGGAGRGGGLGAGIGRGPEKFTYGSIGRGSLSHLAMASLAIKAGVNIVHLPFPGSPAAVTALLRGDVQMAVLPAASVAPLAAEGKLKLLAVTSPQRSRLFPELPTLREAGIAGVEADAWVGLIAPAGTSEAILSKIHKEVVAVLADGAVAEKLKAPFIVPIANSPQAFRAGLQKEHDRSRPTIPPRGIKVE